MKHLNAKQTYRLSMFTAAIIFAISTMWTIVEVAAGSRTFWDLWYIPAFYLIVQATCFPPVRGSRGIQDPESRLYPRLRFPNQ